MDTIVFTRMPLPTVRTSTFSTISTCSYSSLSPISFSFSCSKKLKVVYGSQHLRKKQQTSSLVTRRRIRCGIVEEINEGQFSDVVLKSDRPVLVEFVATWCGPCRLIAPAVESLAQEYEEKLTVVKVDHDSNPRLIEEYKVYGLPAMILFKDGKEVPDSRREGAITKVKLKEYVDALLQSVSVA